MVLDVVGKLWCFLNYWVLWKYHQQKRSSWQVLSSGQPVYRIGQWKRFKEFQAFTVGGVSFFFVGYGTKNPVFLRSAKLSVRSFVFSTHKQLFSHHEPCLLTKTSFWDSEIALSCMNHEILHHVIYVIQIWVSRITNQYLTFTRYGFIVYGVWYAWINATVLIQLIKVSIKTIAAIHSDMDVVIPLLINWTVCRFQISLLVRKVT
jgi:hypothetical protein